MRLIEEDIWMISPLMRHNFLLSSSTVFMLSIHIASTGPSKMSHLRSGDCCGKVTWWCGAMMESWLGDSRA